MFRQLEQRLAKHMHIKNYIRVLIPTGGLSAIVWGIPRGKTPTESTKLDLPETFIVRPVPFQLRARWELEHEGKKIGEIRKRNLLGFGPTRLDWVNDANQIIATCTTIWNIGYTHYSVTVPGNAGTQGYTMEKSWVPGLRYDLKTRSGRPAGSVRREQFAFAKGHGWWREWMFWTQDNQKLAEVSLGKPLTATLWWQPYQVSCNTQVHDVPPTVLGFIAAVEGNGKWGKRRS
eukprot:TRINITY_DN16933_c0_g1_i2.p1 TRINITY_DN16933_c0_g1~~TRINITY_DN16933_c0_g1_i2.p1  ORF type:complete len:232 (+),score=5.31 TRINITY_DN16933_c0_g1_i2:125-820(+)